MSILTNNLEFIRIRYGGPRSQIVVIIMYVCQCCGWTPKYDYDYWVVSDKVGSAIWYYAKCCGMHDKAMMNGAFGIIYKGKHDLSFVYRIKMPDGKFANICGWFKLLNLLRVGNCDVDMDVMSTVETFVASLKKIIGNDAEFAAKALRKLGARQETHQVVAPIGVDLQYKKPLGDQDGFIQFTRDMTIKPFLNIHSALSAGPNVVESTDLVKGLVAVVLMALSSAPFSTFKEAFLMSNKFGHPIAEKDVPRVLRLDPSKDEESSLVWRNCNDEG